VNLYEEFFSVVRAFGSGGVRYCVVGGMALAFHDQPRFTRDMDFLVLPDQIEGAATVLHALGYFESAPPWTFPNSVLTLHRFVKMEEADFLEVDVLSGADKRHWDIVEQSLEEKWAKGTVRLARRDDLIWMKQQRGSDQDLVDIGNLTRDKDRENR